MNLRIWFFIIVTTLLSIIVIVSFLFSPLKPNSQNLGEIPIFNGSPRPSSSQNQTQQLFVNKIFPAQDISVKNFPTTQIEIEFSQKIQPADLKYTLSPEAKTFVISGQGNIIILSPDPVWIKGITTINILEPVQMEYKINTDIPELPPPGVTEH